VSTWTDVPNPPSPTGINQFPVNPPPFVCWKGPLPDIKPDLPKWAQDNTIIYWYTDQELTVTGQYVPIVEVTASPSSPYSKELSITTGVSTTIETTKEFSASLGVSNDLLSVGVSINKTVSYSTTWSSETSVTDTFNLAPTETTVSAVWWQLVYYYSVVGTKQQISYYVMPGIQTTPGSWIRHTPQSFTDSMMSRVERFEECEYPGGLTSSARIYSSVNSIFTK
jgi:hypothetical protein